MRRLAIWILCGISSKGNEELDVVENVLFGDASLRGDCRYDTVQRADSQRIVCRDRDTMRCRRFGLQNDVTAHLMDSSVSPNFAKAPNQGFSAQIARELHATAMTSSRTSRKRMDVGGAESK